jgi:hypothetical protein
MWSATNGTTPDPREFACSRNTKTLGLQHSQLSDMAASSSGSFTRATLSPVLAVSNRFHTKIFHHPRSISARQLFFFSILRAPV